MDSLTHALLGAAIGESVLGRETGKKVLAAGAFTALVPDIDVFLGLFMSDIDKLVFHRGITHSFVFIIFTSPLLGWLCRRADAFLSRRKASSRPASASFLQWTFLALITQLSHILLDSFTSYGTQIYLPFTSEAIALSTISIIDPLFTLPLLLAVSALSLLRRGLPFRHLISTVALLLSCLYLGGTIINKLYVEKQFMNAFSEAGIEVAKTDIKPTLFNNLLWRGIGREQGTDVYHTGYFSLADGKAEIKLYRLEGHHHRIAGWQSKRGMQRLRWVSEGFYQIEQHPDGFVFNDLRFGRVSEFSDDETTPYAFSYLMQPKEDELQVKRIELNVEPQRERRSLGLLWARIWGEEQF